MISISEAIALLQENLPQLRLEERRLAEALGYCLAEEILAPEPSPRFTNSAMDGYGVRAADVAAACKDIPVSLGLVGESRAGEPFPGAVGPGEAIRISTGAMLADGVDAVVRVEDTREEGNFVHIFTGVRPGQDVRWIGEEFARGDKLLSRGARLGSRQLALLAAVGIEQVRVFARPRLAIVGTGSELIAEPGQEPAPHQIRNSNTMMLQNAIREAGGEVVDCCQVADDPEATVAAINQAMMASPDIILVSGGVSVGRHDHVKEAATRAGFAEIFWRVRQKPGKPLFLARLNNTLLFGLPGNPVSAFMCFTHYVRPALAWLRGMDFTQPAFTARASERIGNSGKRANFLRVTVSNRAGEIPSFARVARQGSHMLSSLVPADGYISLEPGEIAEPGSSAKVFLF